MSEYNIPSLQTLIEQFERLPSIGHKSAIRLAYHVLSLTEPEVQRFTEAITDAHKKIHRCKICCNLTDSEICPVCSDEKRDRSTICVVENPRDAIALEKTKELNVLYHVLHGVISPLSGTSPDALTIKELLGRLSDGTVKELIMATNATVEGEATAMYISKLVKPMGIRVTRLAFGIPVGGDLEYTDEVTLMMSIEGRKEL